MSRAILRMLVVVLVWLPWILILLSLPGTLGLFRLETDWIRPCVEHLRAARVKLLNRQPLTAQDLLCPATGACYRLSVYDPGDICCQGIHYDLEIRWMGVNQKGASPTHCQVGLRIRRRVSIRLRPDGSVQFLVPVTRHY